MRGVGQGFLPSGAQRGTQGEGSGEHPGGVPELVNAIEAVQLGEELGAIPGPGGAGQDPGGEADPRARQRVRPARRTHASPTSGDSRRGARGR